MIEKKALSAIQIADVLHEDITQCVWMDGFGRKVLIRRRAFDEVLNHLQNLTVENLTDDSKELRLYVIQMINDGRAEEKFVFDDSKERDLPVPIFPVLLRIQPFCFSCISCSCAVSMKQNWI